MIDRYGKEMTTTFTVEHSDKPTKMQITLSQEVGIEETLDVIYTILLGLGWQESTIIEGMNEWSMSKMGASSCYDKDGYRYSYQEAYDNGKYDEQGELKRYLKDNPAVDMSDNTGKLVDVNKYIEFRNKKAEEED